MRPLALMCFLVHFLAANLWAQQDYEDLRLIFEGDSRPLPTFEKFVETQPDNPWAWHFLGLALEECGLQERAGAALERALSLDDRQAWHWQAMAAHWEGRRSWEQVEFCLRKALELEQRPGPVRALEQRLLHAGQQANLHRQQQEDIDSLPYRMVAALLGGLAFLILLAALLRYMPTGTPGTLR